MVVMCDKGNGCLSLKAIRNRLGSHTAAQVTLSGAEQPLPAGSTNGREGVQAGPALTLSGPSLRPEALPLPPLLAASWPQGPEPPRHLELRGSGQLYRWETEHIHLEKAKK